MQLYLRIRKRRMKMKREKEVVDWVDMLDSEYQREGGERQKLGWTSMKRRCGIGSTSMIWMDSCKRYEKG